MTTPLLPFMTGVNSAEDKESRPAGVVNEREAIPAVPKADIPQDEPQGSPNDERDSTEDTDFKKIGEKLNNYENIQTAEFLHNCAPFIAKLYSLVNSKEYSKYVGWTESNDGKSFTIKDTVLFSSEVLPKHFKHANLSSFVRQLNIYGFHKVRCVD